MELYSFAETKAMESILVRAATINDMATLLRFEQGIIAAERPFDPTLKQGDETRYYDLNMMIAHPIYILLWRSLINS